MSIDDARIVEKELASRGLLDHVYADVVYARVNKKDHTALFNAITKLRSNFSVGEMIISLTDCKNGKD